jgi:hypothetical protein
MSTVLLFYDIDVAYVNKRAFSPSANAAKMPFFLIDLSTLLTFCVRQVEACLLTEGERGSGSHIRVRGPRTMVSVSIFSTVMRSTVYPQSNYSGRTKYSAFVSKLNKLSEEFLSPQKTQKAAVFFIGKILGSRLI